jgi:hypothetical protein
MTLTTLLCSGLVTLGVAAHHLDGAPPTNRTPRHGIPLLCDAKVDVEQQYAVTGRVKMLLIWTGRREVGQARFARFESSEGAGGLTLLIGTDPDRAPMRLNRWGYIAETTCNAETLVTGVMTESNEQSIDQATARGNQQAQRLPLLAIRSRVSAREAATETSTIIPTRTVTYRDVQDVLTMAPSSTTSRSIAVPPHAESGFLRAVTSLIQQSAQSYRPSAAPATGLHRLYVYAGTLYDMRLLRSRTTDTTGELESDFQVQNRTTGATTEFQISYAASGKHSGVARRIVYRPRWWLELELLLRERP